MEEIREYVRLVLKEELERKSDPEEDLLLEPDETEEGDDPKKENPLAVIAQVISIASAAKSLAS